MAEKQERISIVCPKKLAEDFGKACKKQDTNTSQCVRNFMRDYIAKNEKKSND
mgnify:CR=1 FL=1